MFGGHFGSVTVVCQSDSLVAGDKFLYLPVFKMRISLPLVLVGALVARCVGVELKSAANKPEIFAEYEPKSHVIFKEQRGDGSEPSTLVRIGKEDHVGKLMLPLCERFSFNDCLDTMDNIRYILSDMYYAPLLEHATAEDMTSSRIDVVKYFATHFPYSRYLEIGTCKDDLFTPARSWFPYAVGVDPVEGGTHRMTSDEFFATNSEYFDVIFVDGLHEAYQVYRDVHHALKWLKPGGTIIMHDSNPHTFKIQNGTEHIGDALWTGDTWKASVALRMRRDIEIVVVDIDFGVGVIRKRENKHPLPQEWLDELGVSPITMLEYPMLEVNRHTLLRLMTLADMRRWVEEEFEGGRSEL